MNLKRKFQAILRQINKKYIFLKYPTIYSSPLCILLVKNELVWHVAAIEEHHLPSYRGQHIPVLSYTMLPPCVKYAICYLNKIFQFFFWILNLRIFIYHWIHVFTPWWPPPAYKIEVTPLPCLDKKSDSGRFQTVLNIILIFKR